MFFIDTLSLISFTRQSLETTTSRATSVVQSPLLTSSRHYFGCLGFFNGAPLEWRLADSSTTSWYGRGGEEESIHEKENGRRGEMGVELWDSGGNGRKEIVEGGLFPCLTDIAGPPAFRLHPAPPLASLGLGAAWGHRASKNSMGRLKTGFGGGWARFCIWHPPKLFGWPSGDWWRCFELA
jgi:hypothetical protein